MISLSRIELADADINFPVALLGLAVLKLALLRFTGDVLAHVTSLVIGRSEMRGIVILHWRAVGSALMLVSPLGDYELRFVGEGAAVHVFLRML